MICFESLRHMTSQCAVSAALIVSVSNFAYSQSEEQDAAHPATVIWPHVGPIAGQVVDRQGKPVDGVTVILNGNRKSNLRLPHEYRTTTMAGGNFSFPVGSGMLGGNTRMTVAHKDYAIQTLYLNSHFDGRKYDDFRIVLDEGKTIGGRIIDANEKGVSDIRVSLETYSGAKLGFSHSSATTDAEGSFEIHNAPDYSHHTLRLRKDGVVHKNINWYSDSAELPTPPKLPEGMVAIDPQVYVRNGFTYKLTGMFRVRIEGVHSESGESIDLKWAAYKLLPRGSIFEQTSLRRLPAGNVESDFTFTDIEYGPYRFFCEPDPSTRLLGGFFSESFHKRSKSGTRHVKFVPGNKISGSVVDAETLKPVPNVQLKYLPDKIEEFERLGVMPQLTAKTNADGRFEFLVPSGPGEIRMFGEVPGYMTISAINDPLPDGIREKYSKIISPKTGQAVPKIQFLLRRAPVVRVLAVDQLGNPVPNVAYVATHFRENNGGSTNGSFIAGQSDGQGRFQIDAMFDDANYKYDQPSKFIRDIIARGRRIDDVERHIKRNRIWCWDQENSLAGSAIVNFEEVDEKRLVVELAPPSTVQGKLVDASTDAGMPGVTVSVFADLASLFRVFRWSTKTNEDGVFTLTHLFPDTKYRFEIYKKDYQFNATTITTADSEPLVLTEIRGVNVSELNKPIVVVDVSKLSDQEALDKFVEFVQKQMERAPAERPDGWNHGDPSAVFRRKLSKAINEQMMLLAARHPDSDFQCQVYLKIIEELCRGAERGGVSSSVEWLDQARLDLIKNIDREGVFEAYKAIEWQMSSTMFEMSIMKQSKKREIRAWAYRSLLRERSWELAHACSSKRTTNKQFELKLEQVKKIWQQGIDEFGDVALPARPGRPAGTMKDLVRSEIKGVSDRLQRDKDYEKSRVKKVLELIKQFEPKKKI